MKQHSFSEGINEEGFITRQVWQPKRPRVRYFLTYHPVTSLKRKDVRVGPEIDGHQKQRKKLGKRQSISRHESFISNLKKGINRQIRIY
ncbi:hypothetical protein GXP67_09760 [Rhodocytophaga rosea]|uniref:Uncharacterized protein n=1 Tax=Rhodocytophaga rosea TaxID=2704465 RepID=A0A6C0GGV1_9BACT|nr:hypothetical protein [Rhodocytophaga rosea]QHT66920.1 hypothetical protein GXP67_09760 [Rhodocytophaga rosea]